MIVTKTVYLIARPNMEYDWEKMQSKDTISFVAWPHNKYDDASIVVGEVTVQFEVEDNLDPKKLRLIGLREEKKKIEADFQARITEIQRQINECLAIEG